MTTLTENRTASIIVALEKDDFTIKIMIFNGGELSDEDEWTCNRSEEVTFGARCIIRALAPRPTSAFITVSAAKRMTDEQIAAIQATALRTRA